MHTMSKLPSIIFGLLLHQLLMWFALHNTGQCCSMPCKYLSCGLPVGHSVGLNYHIENRVRAHVLNIAMYV